MYNQYMQTNEAYPTEAPSMQHVSIRKEVELDVAKLQLRLEIGKQMLQLLDENPVIEKFMNLSRGIL
jgi:hypothetical protein